LISLLSVFLLNTRVYAREARIFEINGRRIETNRSPIRMYVNDVEVRRLDIEPIIFDGAMLVPYNCAFLFTGVEIRFDSVNGQLTYLYEGNRIIMNIDSTYCFLNGRTVNMLHAPRIVNGSVMVPLRFVAENLGLTVGWDGRDNVVSINSNNGFSWDDVPVELIQSNEQTKEEKSRVNEISLSSTYTEDILTIDSTIYVEPNIFYLHSPDRIVIEIPDSELSVSGLENYAGNFINNIRYENYGDGVRIILDMSRQARFTFQRDVNSIKMRLAAPTFDNIVFNYSTREIVLAKGPYRPISMYDIIRHDDYFNNRYTLDLNGNFLDTYGFGNYIIRDNLIERIQIDSNNYTTRLTLHGRQILAVSLREDDENIYISVKTPQEKYSMIFILDPGHGGRDPGAVYFGMHESYLNLDIAQRVHELAVRDGIVKTYFTRETDIFLTLRGSGGCIFWDA
jgi:N-acetylmuramoyl-L-alanine amidase